MSPKASELLSIASPAQTSSHLTAATSASSYPLTLLERIRALNKSSELAHLYTAWVLLDTSCIHSEDNYCASTYVAVGHVETSLIHSTLIHCRNEEGDPIFALDRMPNRFGVVKEVLVLYNDLQHRGRLLQQILEGEDGNGNEILFQKRTAALEHVTNHLLASGVISHKHTDVYPVHSFPEPSGPYSSKTTYQGGAVMAYVNRSTAPYLGIDSVGVHLICYVCSGEHHGESHKNEIETDVHNTIGSERGNNNAPKKYNNHNNAKIEGVWLAKRAPTKSHHPNYWDPTVAGGQPAHLSLYANIIKEAYEEAGVPPEWIRNHFSNASWASPNVDEPNVSLPESNDRIRSCANTAEILFSDITHDPLTITTAKTDGSCLKYSRYYSFDLQVPRSWIPTPIDGEVSEFKLFSMKELEDELRFGNSVRPAMRAVLLDFMLRHGTLGKISGEESWEELGEAMRQERLVLW